MNSLLKILRLLIIHSIFQNVTSRVILNSRKNYKKHKSSDNSIDDGGENALEKLSKNMLSYMDFKINPCDDFYEYACGNFDSVVGFDDPDTLVHFFKELNGEMARRIKTLLELDINDNLHLKEFKGYLKKAQRYYNSCMNTDLYKKEPVSEYLEYVKDNIGFPAVDDQWNSKAFDMGAATAQVNKFGIDTLFDASMADGYPFCPVFKSIYNFGLDNSIHLEDLENRHSRNFMGNFVLMNYLLKLYGVENSTKRENVIDEIMSMGKILLKFTEIDFETVYSRASISYFLDEFDEFSNETFDMNSYLKVYLEDDNYDVESDMVILKPFILFSNHTSNELKPEAVANYASLKLLYILHSELSYPKSKEKLCIRKVTEDLSFLIAKIYIAEYWKNEDYLYKMFNYMKEALIDLHKSAEWLDSESRENFIMKAQMEEISMGYVNHSIVQEFCDILEDSNITDNYYENNINIQLSNHRLEIYNFIHNVSNDTQPKKVLNPIEINASYNEGTNTLQIYAAIFMPPLYDPLYPESINYAGIGEIIGHEMTHAFDNDGIHTNTISNDDEPWLSENSTTAYHTLVEDCFEKQYSEFYYPEVNLTIDGRETLSENISDNGGIKLAYWGYKKAMKANRSTNKSQKLPNMNLTGDQVFFLAHASKYCRVYFPKNFMEEISSKYSFFRSRVNGPVINFDEFARAFHCPIGSKMNPEKKCAVF